MDKMKSLSIDLETFSDVDLKKCGVYRYAESPNFEILLFAYSEDNGPVQVVDLACGEEVPDHILAALTDEEITKWAYNASFERVCLSYWLRKHHPEHFCSYSIPEDTVGYYLDPSSWKCSRIWGAYMGLPLSLEGIGAVLKLNDQKMKEGKDLIRYFCVPCKPTKTNGGRTRNLPEHDREKWETFKSYNKRDVEVELAVKDRLTKYPVPEFIWDQYHLDQEINDRGIRVDMQLVRNAISIDAQTKHSLLSQMQNSTGLENPNSVSQMKGGFPIRESKQNPSTRRLSKNFCRMPTAMWPMYFAADSSLPSHPSASTRQWRIWCALTAEPEDASCFMVQAAPADGQAGASNCRTFLRTTWKIWKKPETSSVTVTSPPWSFSMIIPRRSFPN